MAHKNFDRDLGKMLELLVDGELDKYERKLIRNQSCQNIERRKVDGNTQIRQIPGQEQTVVACDEQLTSITKDHNRYIPRKIRTLVWAKYKGECSYQDPLTGKKCSSRHGIQIDHKLALARGGDHRPDNLTLLCASHNAWKGTRQIE